MSLFAKENSSQLVSSGFLFNSEGVEHLCHNYITNQAQPSPTTL